MERPAELVEASLPAFWQKLSSFEDILDDEFKNLSTDKTFFHALSDS